MILTTPSRGTLRSLTAALVSKGEYASSKVHLETIRSEVSNRAMEQVSHATARARLA